MNELQIKAASQLSGTILPGWLLDIDDMAAATVGLAIHDLPALKALVVSKTEAGLSTGTVAALSRLVRAVAAGTLPLNFLVFDFHHAGSADTSDERGYRDLVQAVTDLILDAPVVSVALARGTMAGADLELALACSMMIADETARFTFGGDAGLSTGLYRVLAQKIGFVRAERLIEMDGAIDGAHLGGLLLLKEVVPTQAGTAGLEGFLRRMSRRHNSCCGMYRAQRIATPSMSERLGLAG